MSFHYPKDFAHNHSLLQKNSRPQPSPSKQEQFLKELGIDYDGDALTDSCTSGSDDDLFGSKPSEIELRMLRKELDQYTEKCGSLKEENRELQLSLNRLNARFVKEQTSKKIRLKILNRAYKDGMKDKQALIMELQEMIGEDGDKENMKMVSIIQDLHQDKANLHQELLSAQENYDQKIAEIEDRYSNNIHLEIDSSASQALEKVSEEKSKLQTEIADLRKEQQVRINSYENLLKEKDSELVRANQEKEKKSRSHNSIKLKLETLRNELNASKMSIQEKEEDMEAVVQKQKEEIEKLEKDNKLAKKQMETLEADMTSRLNSEMQLTQSSVNLQEENRKLMKDADRYQMLISELEHDKSRLETIDAEKKQLASENEDLRSELERSVQELERHRVSWKEKMTFVEREREEAQVLLHQQRRKATSDAKEMMALMEEKEEQLKREVEESNQAYREMKIKSDQSLKRMEEKLMESSSRRKILEDQVSELKREVMNKSSEIATLERGMSSVEEEGRRLVLILTEKERDLDVERKKADQLSGDLTRARVEKESLDRQLAVMSGESGSVIAQMEEESRDLRIKLSSAEERIRILEREQELLLRKKKDLEEKVSRADAALRSDAERHKAEREKLLESHRRDVMKLKASSAIAAESSSSRVSALESALRLVTSTLRQLGHDKATLRREVTKFPSLLKEAIKHAGKQVADAVAEISETNKDLVRRYRKEMALRKKYHNELVELRGNIRVFVRARPLISEDGKNAKIAVSYDDSDDAVIYINNPQKGRSQTFEVDRVFPGRSTQEEVYAEVQALVTSCMDGYHVCIFAYGQTGSGKTHTMEGTPDDPGINQRALDDLFRMIDDRSGDWDYCVTVSLVEIYNETLRDLLNSKQEKLEIKMNPDGSLFVQRLREVEVKNLDDVNKLFRIGRSSRATASTNMNERSSRSHAVLMIRVEGANPTTGSSSLGRLNLIDLAGSERVSKSGASGDRLKEAQNINRSLSALGDVIHALRQKQGHVPFRNSKLTYLLQDSLSKESKTLMMVQVSPIEASLGESVCSLNFAQRVRAVELGQATKKTKSGR